MVSTIHKAKGKEWDEVFLCVKEDFFKDKAQIESTKRLAYVAITRAKNKLHIHTKIPFFNDFIKPSICNNSFRKLKTIVLLTGLSDVILSNNYSKNGIANTSPMAGEEVGITDNNSYINIMKDGQQISSLSEKMRKEIREQQNNGYVLQTAEVENVVIWKKSGEEFKQVLCKIYLILRPLH